MKYISSVTYLPSKALIMDNKGELNTILQLLKSRKPYLKAKYSVEKIALFGSFAKFNQNAKSDVDLLVKTSETLTIFNFLKLENYLSKTLGRKVDLGTFSSTKPQVQEDIKEDIIYV